jgi:DNA-binding response OmpR family regulator
VIELTTGEFDLLHALAQHSGRVRNRDQLLQETHHRDAGPFDRTIDVQIGRLRKKLGDDGKSPKLIKAVRGVGYVFTPTRS